MSCATLNNAVKYDTDVFVADYTNVEDDNRRIIISTEKPSDLEYFHFENKNNVQFYGVNLEDSPSLFKGHKNCECVFEAISSNTKSWVCLVELKYCLENNVETNAAIAFEQLYKTLDFLVEKRIIDLNQQKVYLNISIPEHSEKAPFTSFVNSQDRILSQYEDNRVILLGENHLLIMTPVHIHIPEVEI